MALAATLARGRIYYGWYIVATALVVNMLSTALTASASAVFLQPMTRDLAWSRTDFQLVLTIGVILPAVIAMPLGPLVDRGWGRRLLIGGAVVAGVGTMMLGLVHSRWEFFLLRGILIPLGIVETGRLVTGVVVANWFLRQRGRAMSIAAMGMAIATITMTPLAGVAAQYWGWRWAWVLLGVLILALVVPLATLFMKTRPEEVGLLPDGEASASTAKAAARRQDVSWTRGEALRTRTLWLITVAVGLHALVRTSIQLHSVAYMVGPPLNMSALAASAVIGIGGWASLVARFPWAFLADRIPERYCAAFNFALLVGALAAILTSRSAWAITLAFIPWGAGIGGAAPFQDLLFANSFGRLHLGSIRSVTTPIMVGLTAVGPLIASVLFDITGSYRTPFLILAVLAAISAVLILFAKPPVKPGTAGA